MLDRAELIAVLRQIMGRRLAAAAHQQEGALDRLESEVDRAGAGKDGSRPLTSGDGVDVVAALVLEQPDLAVQVDVKLSSKTSGRSR